MKAIATTIALQAKDAFLRLSYHDRFRILAVLSLVPSYLGFAGITLLCWLLLAAWLYSRAFSGEVPCDR